jgi:mRNA interferase RelE/StbE
LSVSYSVFLAPAAERQLKKLPPQIKTQLVPVLKALANDPRPPGAKKLKGSEDIWRIRKGSYRILYEINDRELTVLALRIDHRKQVYRDT